LLVVCRVLVKEEERPDEWVWTKVEESAAAELRVEDPVRLRNVYTIKF
jgi:hypothetical protein